jgi:universal stress protein F
MYKNILIPVAFDEDHDAAETLDLARKLAAPGAKFTLLHVVEHIPGYAISYIPAEFLSETRIAIQVELDKLAAKLDNATGVLIEGHSGRGILDWAEANSPDLIIVASHRPGMQDLLLGSTASMIVRHATCSVHVTR